MKQLILSLLAFLTLAEAAQAAKTLPLEEFLRMVKRDNQAVRASDLMGSGLLTRQDEGEILLAPTLGLDAGWSADKRETLNPAFQGTSTEGSTYSVSISKLTSFGLSGKFAYGVTNVDIANASLLSMPRYTTASPSVELRQSLWRNGFGSETRAQQALLSASNRLQGHGEIYKSQLQLIDARNAYWRLALARQIVAVQKDVYERAGKIFEWAEGRAKTGLGDRADMLQAQASQDLRRIELRAALEEEKMAALAFNAALNRSGEQVAEELENPAPDTLAKLAPPARTVQRTDVQAAAAQQDLAIANSQLAKEKAAPSFDLFVNYSWNGKGPELSPAQDKAHDSRFSNTALGVKFSAPLYFGTMSDVRAAAAKETMGAELAFDRKVFEENRDWADLNRKFADAKERLRLTENLAAIQKEKMTYEQARLKRGRSTTYQTLVFEQDYAQARVLRIRIQSEILALYNQMRLYGAE